MKILGIIPARAGSKSILHKNTVTVAERPLIDWTFDSALNSTWLSRVAVTTDCEKVKWLASSRPGIEIIHRPKELAQDDTPIVPVLKHALSVAGEVFDAVMLLQPTCPMRRACDIDMACQLMHLSEFKQSATSVISYVDVGPNHPARMVAMVDRVPTPFVKDQQWANKQALPKVYLRSGDIYLTKTETLLAGDLVGDKPRAFFIGPERHCNIDSKLDLEWADWLLTREKKIRAATEINLARVGDYFAGRS